MRELLLQVIETTITFSVIIIILLIFNNLFGRKFTAKCRYIIWILVFVRLAVPFVPDLNISLFTYTIPSEEYTSSGPDFSGVESVKDENTTGVADIQSTESSGKESKISSGIDFLSIVSYIWLGGMIVYLIYHIVLLQIYKRKLNKNLVSPDEKLLMLYNSICEELKIKKGPKLYILKDFDSPMLLGLFRKKIIIPEYLKDEKFINCILSHELTHFKRKDLLIKILILFVNSIYWFNPIIRYGSKVFESEIELSCDEYVLKIYNEQDRISYGNTMLEVVKKCYKKKMLLSTHFNPRKSTLKERFYNIVDNSKKKQGKIIIISILMVCIFAGAIGVFVLPGIEKATDSESSGVLNIFRSGYKPVNFEFKSQKDTLDKKSLIDSGYSVCGIYEYTNENAKILTGVSNKVLINDDDYIIYDYITKESYVIDLPDVEYTDIHLIYDVISEKVTGIIFADSQNKEAIYNIEKEDFITKYNYANTDSVCAEGKVISYSDNGAVVINVDTGNTEFTMSDSNVESFELLYGNGEDYYFIKQKGMYYTVYNNKYKVSGKEENTTIEPSLSDKGLVIATEDLKSYNIYDEDNNIVYTGEKYNNLLFLSREVACVVDSHNDFLIVDVKSGKELKNFGEWKDTYSFIGTPSGYYEKSNYKSGYYLMVYDNTLNEGTADGNEFYYNPDTGESSVTKTTIGAYGKPVLYIYPENDTRVLVEFEHPDYLTTTYPKYEDSWDVLVKKDGSIYDKNNRYYYGLYWEENCYINADFSTGFYVTTENAISFLEENLDVLGFTDREANEFIMYWLPILEKNGKSLVYFEQTESREKYNKLNISPEPDSILRVAIHVKKVSEFVDIKPEKLNTFERKGFTAVEWGGVIY